MTTPYEQSKLKKIYGTFEDLEEQCDKSIECWAKISQFKYCFHQKPYKPYRGDSYIGVMFAGINLNGGNNSNDAIDILVQEAIDNYLIHGKYLIFKQDGYRGSPFYYYVPLMSFLYTEYLNKKVQFYSEDKLTTEQVISGFNFCGLTNLIKCSVNSPDGRSTPSDSMYSNCIKKLQLELIGTETDVLVIFTLFGYPSLVAEYFDGFDIIYESERSRVQKKDGFYIVELEHPVSTKVTRKQKFESYSKAIYHLVDIKDKT